MAAAIEMYLPASIALVRPSLMEDGFELNNARVVSTGPCLVSRGI